MFQVHPLEGFRWIIVDDEDNQVFEGTWRECESWLDVHENLTTISPPRSFLNRCWQSLFGEKSRLTAGEIKPEPNQADMATIHRGKQPLRNNVESA
ncbi:MAG: hypothetical protein O2955_04280 [Planctomycetota bacterium]|nr:hypothetical protein [Planctomycetota bacterium]MDA1211707.1 hypothetical protein [Planctomycetota bacterium]